MHALATVVCRRVLLKALMIAFGLPSLLINGRQFAARHAQLLGPDETSIALPTTDGAGGAARSRQGRSPAATPRRGGLPPRSSHRVACLFPAPAQEACWFWLVVRNLERTCSYPSPPWAAHPARVPVQRARDLVVAPEEAPVRTRQLRGRHRADLVGQIFHVDRSEDCTRP